MAREIFMVVRMDATERQRAEAVATRMGRTESALVRQLIDEKARRLGIPTEPRKEARELDITPTSEQCQSRHETGIHT
jgi:antitoxin component of RelBE/YafQ-DinJ toxin-antitoxin module